VFGLLATLTLVLSVITFKAAGQVGAASQAVTLRVGPELAKSILLSFVWGVAGGAIGGLAQGRSLPRASKITSVSSWVSSEPSS
jgi:hypothetical protein